MSFTTQKSMCINNTVYVNYCLITHNKTKVEKSEKEFNRNKYGEKADVRCI